MFWIISWWWWWWWTWITAIGTDKWKTLVSRVCVCVCARRREPVLTIRKANQLSGPRCQNGPPVRERFPHQNTLFLVFRLWPKKPHAFVLFFSFSFLLIFFAFVLFLPLKNSAMPNIHTHTHTNTQTEISARKISPLI
jgi:hypothetical protein